MYNKLDKNIEEQIGNDIKCGILSPYRFDNENTTRRNQEKDKNSVLRTAFGRDIEKILNIPLYNRYNDKT